MRSARTTRRRSRVPSSSRQRDCTASSDDCTAHSPAERGSACCSGSHSPVTLRCCSSTSRPSAWMSSRDARSTRAEVVEAAGLHGLERRLYGTLSGGERQRVLSGLALAGNPALLFLAEPTVGMDVESRRAFHARIAAHRDAGRAVLLTTHYLDEADALADRVVVLDRGRIVADGSPADVRHTVALHYVRCVTNVPVREIRAWRGVIDVQKIRDAVVISVVEPEHVVRTLLTRDASLSGLEVRGAALEDAFLALTRSSTREVA